MIDKLNKLGYILLMKKFKFVFQYIIIFYIVTLFSSCWTEYNFHFLYKNQPSTPSWYSDRLQAFDDNKIFIGLQKSADGYILRIEFIKDILFQEQQIKKFEFDSCLVKIGDQEIILNKNEIFIRIYTGGNEWLHTVYDMREGNEYVSQFNEPYAIENNYPYGNSNMRYTFRLLKRNIPNKEIKKLLSNYKRDNRKVSLYLKYTILIDNETFVNEIIEEYNLEIKTWTNNIFRAIMTV
jgi:hypothetical protein